ncbi:MAG: hypothetical protein HY332_02750 [Chloroflexi bacterium]|nr:hypothetical protein [Chloroflexota bacterium]
MSTTPASPGTAPATQVAGSELLRVLLREAPQAPAIDPARFRATLDLIRAKPEEQRWATIPWQTDLWEARKLAADENKPIFLWAMNGNPLGCV